ncbi:putative quinoprotein glucose dehydrogenase (PQQ, quinone) [Helianthus annuus]|uniref:Putative catalytic domain-containing protein n=1 Tax=Helianthus annuus TaxID=4232 RepID=A0A251U2D6_HELAN|nr:HIPL1 protein [Helianthus annuus]KAF5792760.1 putative quinoprotein glucose dehydrogenase (PQQ, quinone) [Helianthus annuus]KAJ0527673.1 putative quinoprotein glucose dehydrogenase (PQQ, quinone) [Helianthus annuus]KAJ0536435.1 putative quinoprotein glucose dehydrogenase (PQQ, quinone) [Helianthus annuus]KAJ0544082.1 putative quinoprotein glucose dehydrogenase (PQQ, quinone) [Helianthus annuus]KAJ0713000.1 putative quinoprotein glucose dehydrogenase (PQQ, quinone) [Helianthus annuus]
MMKMNILLLLSLTLFLLLISPALSLPLCTDLSAPVTHKTPLTFCNYNGSSCCDSTDDSNIRKQFESMNVSQPACASVLKSILCSRCDPFSAELFTIKTVARQVPVLCNSTVSSTNNYCETVWDTCQNVSITNSPFSPSSQGEAPTPTNSSNKLTDIWQSRSDFCNIIGGPSVNNSVCFDGKKVSLNITTNSTKSPPTGMCLEKIANGSYLDMVAHTDGSNRAFFSNQKGQVWLATIPEVGSGRGLELDESNPFLDLTDQVHFDTQFGLMSIALHPNFAQNGRFFASFNCDKTRTPSCAGRCACNSDVNCDPSKLTSDSAAQPCQYQSVVAEYSANVSSSSRASIIPTASPVEVRRILTMGLPFTSHHAGQILFGPNDGYLYFMMGDGGGGDPYNFAQNKKSLLGKIMRFDVDNIPSESEVTRLGLWGNYSIPSDNPYIEDKDLQPEIWALGLQNPWRCSFDSERPSYFMCGDVGQNDYEEVDIITKNGNYGWRVYEGTTIYTPEKSPGGNTSISSINPIFSVMGYKHKDINKNEGSASITGGFFYRSTTDPCLYGSYLYGDLYAHNLWAGVETPENSGNFTTSNVTFGCAKDSPVPCDLVPGSELPTLGYLFSYGQDNNKDVYLLSSSGVYRIVPPSRCGYTCAYESRTEGSTPAPTSPRGSSSNMLKGSCKSLLLLLLLFIGLSY